MREGTTYVEMWLDYEHDLTPLMVSEHRFSLPDDRATPRISRMEMRLVNVKPGEPDPELVRMPDEESIREYVASHPAAQGRFEELRERERESRDEPDEE